MYVYFFNSENGVLQKNEQKHFVQKRGNCSSERNKINIFYHYGYDQNIILSMTNSSPYCLYLYAMHYKYINEICHEHLSGKIMVYEMLECLI
jgi:hypothetical protein